MSPNVSDFEYALCSTACSQTEKIVQYVKAQYFVLEEYPSCTKPMLEITQTPLHHSARVCACCEATQSVPAVEKRATAPYLSHLLATQCALHCGSLITLQQSIRAPCANTPSFIMNTMSLSSITSFGVMRICTRVRARASVMSKSAGELLVKNTSSKRVLAHPPPYNH